MSNAESGVAPAERTARGAKPGAGAAEQPVASDVGRPVAGDAGLFARELWDPRVQSKQWLEAMSLAMDAWLRSGAFLEFMQQGLQAAIAFQRLQPYGPTSAPTEPSVEVGAEPPDHHSGKKE